MNISIFTICTGKYNIFFENFYNSSEKFFLTNHSKKYYVFTDSEILSRENIVKVYQKKLGWPYDTMMRFHMFNRVRTEVLKSDYIFFFNVNLNFVDQINDEVLPNEENDYLVGVNHPGYYNTDIKFAPFERNSISEFYIPFGQGRTYFQGCLNGGRSINFMDMSKELEYKMNSDLVNKHIPIWHDESALNWYFNQRNPLILPPSYAYPESYNLDIEKKAIQIDKNKLGGHNFLRS